VEGDLRPRPEKFHPGETGWPIKKEGNYSAHRRHPILRIYPVIGHLRYLFESIRPEIQQYFAESDTNGQPVNREFRTLVSHRAHYRNSSIAFETDEGPMKSGNHNQVLSDLRPVVTSSKTE
jgi:hypothetical protein